MLLDRVRIRNFRCIEDTGDFRIDDVTCFVGKNESGKTSVLQALLRFNSDEKLIASRDYPKRKWAPGKDVPEDPPVLETHWSLDTHDLAAISADHGPGVINKNEIKVSKGYSNTRTWAIDVNERTIVSNLVAPLLKSATPIQFTSSAVTLDGLRSELEAIPSRSADQEAVLSRVSTVYKNGAVAAVRDVLLKRLPKFLYFDQYLRLPGTVSLDAFMQRKNSSQLTDNDLVFEALIALAGTTPEAIHAMKTFEEFNGALRAVSNQITDKIFGYWTQNQYLDVDIRLDMARPSDSAPFNTGSVFRTRIVNKRHRVDTSFDERSTGFVWFFSFLVWFNRLSAESSENLIILLDEPGLTLHARAQADLLRYMREELEPSHQVLYTTHSPFMIDPDRIMSARTVEDVVQMDQNKREVLLGTKVGQDVLSIDRDTVSPLQLALDYEITQTLFIGKHTLLIEGQSDYLYLKWFSQYLKKSKKTELDYRWTMSVVKGIDRIPGFVALFRGNGLHIAALIDVQKNDKQKREYVAGTLTDGHLLTLDTFTGQTEADIEDMLGRDLYAYLLKECYHLQSTQELPVVRAKSTGERLAKETEEHFRSLPVSVSSFDHFEPANYLFNLQGDATKLPGIADAAKRFEALFKTLNALLPKT